MHLSLGGPHRFAEREIGKQMKTYTLSRTNNPKLFRIVDWDGDWTHYAHIESGKIEDIAQAQVLRAVNFILDNGYAKGQGFYEWLKKITPEEAEKKLKDAGDKGDAIHQLIAMCLTGEKVSKATPVLAEDNLTTRPSTWSEWEAYLAWAHFWTIHGVKRIAHEEAVANLLIGYAGTTDCIGRITKACESKYCKCVPMVGQIGILDWKSGSGIYDNYGAQFAAYSKSDLSHLIGGNKIEFTAAIQIGCNHKSNGGYKAEWYDQKETEKHWLEFLAAKTIHDAHYRPFDPNKEIYDIPETVEVSVETEKLV